MPPRSRPPLVLVAFAVLICLVFSSSLLSSAPAPPTPATASVPASTVEPALEAAAAVHPVLVVEQEQDDVDPSSDPPSWSARLAAARHRAFDLAHHLLPSLSSRPPSSPASPSTRPSLRLLGFHGDASLPDCPRTLLFRFQGTRGFASEYLRFVRAAAIAERWGYEVFLADERDKWMYGSVADYFLPPSNRTCRLPTSSPTYPARRKMLPSRAEVLPPLGDDEQDGAGVEWDRTRPERFSARGLERPSWTRVDHVADGYHLGDKCLESANPKYSPLRFATDAQFAELKASGRVRNAGKADECGASTAAAPMVLAMSDDARGALELQRAWAAQGALPGVELRDLAVVATRLEELQGAAADEGQALDTGFDAHVFHEAPLEQRIALTRPFLRDLTLLARESDALVVSQASNVGRLLTLLAGEDVVRSGGVHSVDVRWFPTAYYV
ncbi:hypothetical protein JCM9279_004071 [Rhodotorula babjevae]